MPHAIVYTISVKLMHKDSNFIHICKIYYLFFIYWHEIFIKTPQFLHCYLLNYFNIIIGIKNIFYEIVCD